MPRILNLPDLAQWRASYRPNKSLPGYGGDSGHSKPEVTDQQISGAFWGERFKVTQAPDGTTTISAYTEEGRGWLVEFINGLQ